MTRRERKRLHKRTYTDLYALHLRIRSSQLKAHHAGTDEMALTRFLRHSGQYSQALYSLKWARMWRLTAGKILP